MTTFVLLGFTGWAGYQTWKNQDWGFLWGPPPAPVVAEKMGMVQIISSPQGADVIDQNGVKVGTTPRMIEAKMGQTVKFELKKPGFQSKIIEVKIPPDATEEKPLLLQEKLTVFEPPKPMEVWEDHLGARYKPRDKEHVSEGYVTESAWKSSLPVTKWDKGQVEFLKFSENGKPVEIVLATKEAAVAFCDWLRVGALAEGRLEKHHEVVPAYEQSFQDPKMSEKAREKGLRPFHVIVREINYGMIRLVTNPPGASVYINGEARGVTGEKPVLIGEVKPGKVDVYLVLDGYKPKQETKTVVPGEALTMEAKLDPNDGVVFGKEWQNGLGMKFVPFGDLMVSMWETRVSDYNRFVAATGYPSPRTPEFAQADDSPVVYVRREDAMAFCKWLTEFERKKERISKWHEYRLPTDMEWSRMAELDEEEGLGPLWRDTRKAKSFPWGDAWPPPPGSGNFADTTAALAPGTLLEKTIRNYTDEHAYTAPVGSFPPNRYGIHDLSGNVEEWVLDNYDGMSGSDLGVLRGGGWATYEQDRLYTGSRNPQPVTYPDAMYGFRVILRKIPTPEPSPDLVPSPLDITPKPTPPTPIPPDNG
jgi:formylglycine-generating enzyme required for sulfatase activity